MQEGGGCNGEGPAREGITLFWHLGSSVMLSGIWNRDDWSHGMETFWSPDSMVLRRFCAKVATVINLGIENIIILTSRLNNKLRKCSKQYGWLTYAHFGAIVQNDRFQRQCERGRGCNGEGLGRE